ncbi:MAG: Fumarylacetoacetate hydrolase family protein, partial [uncultured Thermomicrobiales bacterium]
VDLSVPHRTGGDAAARARRRRPRCRQRRCRRPGDDGRCLDATRGRPADPAGGRDRERRRGYTPLRRHPGGADRPAGGLGRRRHLPPIPRRPDGRVDPEERLRPGLRGGPAGAVPEGDAQPRLWSGGGGRRPGRLHLGRAGAGVGAGGQPRRRDRRLHRRQRRLVAVDRGGESALPAAGQGLQPLRRPRPGRRPRLGDPRPDGAADPPHDPPERDRALRRRDLDRPNAPHPGRPRRLPLPGQRVPLRRLPDDGHRDRAALRVHPGRRRRGRDHDRGDRLAPQPRRPAQL